MSAAPLLAAQNIVKHYGSVEALRGASFAVLAGEVVALIGDNGAGSGQMYVRSGAGGFGHDHDRG